MEKKFKAVQVGEMFYEKGYPECVAVRIVDDVVKDCNAVILANRETEFSDGSDPIPPGHFTWWSPNSVVVSLGKL